LAVEDSGIASHNEQLVEALCRHRES